MMCLIRVTPSNCNIVAIIRQIPTVHQTTRRKIEKKGNATINSLPWINAHQEAAAGCHVQLHDITATHCFPDDLVI